MVPPQRAGEAGQGHCENTQKQEHEKRLQQGEGLHAARDGPPHGWMVISLFRCTERGT
jgi:hypothetical protein